MPSLINCRRSRKRLAPTARRIANSLRRLAPRAISMFARFMHASVITKPISATKNPINAGFNFRGIGTLVPAESKVTRRPLSTRSDTEGSCSSRRRVIASRPASAVSIATPGARHIIARNSLALR